jgi:hypothetical protein
MELQRRRAARISAGLEAGAASHLGWWSDSVIARTEVIEQQSEDWPAWLADHYEPRHHGAWDEATESYYVMPRLHPRTGLKPQNEAERDHWPVGMVTPYGRWLQRPWKARAWPLSLASI